MYYYPVSAVLTECLILSVVDPAEAGDRWLSYNVFPRVPGQEAKVLFHHRSRA